MKKKLLFVIPNMRVGGAEKSLLNLLVLFDYDKYDVDLFLFRKDGLFLSQIPKQVNVIGDTENYEIFDGDAKKAVKYFVEKLKFISAIQRYIYSKKDDEKSKWKYLKKQLPKIKTKYDCAIAYLEGNASEFVANNICAEKKICYIHNDIEKLNLSVETNKAIFEKSDWIVTVSDECKESLERKFNQFHDKFVVIENIISPLLLKKMSDDFIAFDDASTIIVTVARCSAQKNLQLAINACKILVDKGFDIKWYQLGSGKTENELKSLIKNLKLENNFIMLGDKPNPYPYIFQSDIYVQTSLFEGKSISIEEAKCLEKPVVVTNFSTVRDQIENGITGLICDMSAVDVADKIQLLIEDRNLREKLSNNLKKMKSGNENEIEKLYNLIK